MVTSFNMDSEARIAHLYQLLQQHSSVVTKASIEDFIGAQVQTGLLSAEVSLEEFLTGFQKELSRLRDLKVSLKAKLHELAEKRRIHTDLYDEAIATEVFNDEGLSEDSHFDLVVLQGRDLGHEVSPHFTVTRDGERVHRSAVVERTPHPVWNERVSIPTPSMNSALTVEVWDDKSQLGTVPLLLDDYYDQCYLTLWYDLQGAPAGELKIAGQWVHSMIKFHELKLHNCETLIAKTQYQLAQCKASLRQLLSVDEKTALRAWLGRKDQPLNLSAKRVMSLINLRVSQASTEHELPSAELNDEIQKLTTCVTRIETPKSRRHSEPTFDFFAVGVFSLRHFR